MRKMRIAAVAAALVLAAGACVGEVGPDGYDEQDVAPEQEQDEGDSVLPPLGNDEPTCTPAVIDFAGFGTGAVVTQLITDGVTSVSCVNNNPAHPNTCITFDSSAPTGGDDDLGTPNQGFGGPGVGTGGEPGEVGANMSALGNLLIIAENDTDADSDGAVDVPDDEGSGGTITMNFFQPREITSVRVVDIDVNEGGSIEVSIQGGGTMSFPLSKLGNNSVQDVAINVEDVTSITVSIPGSGALSNVVYCQGVTSGTG